MKTNKTYLSILYFNFGINERINVGLIIFNDDVCYVRIKKYKMDLVKIICPQGFSLFESSINSFVYFYNKTTPPKFNIINRTSIYNNGMFKLDRPSFISIDLNDENFNRFFDKHI